MMIELIISECLFANSNCEMTVAYWLDGDFGKRFADFDEVRPSGCCRGELL